MNSNRPIRKRLRKLLVIPEIEIEISFQEIYKRYCEQTKQDFLMKVAMTGDFQRMHLVDEPFIC